MTCPNDSMPALWVLVAVCVGCMLAPLALLAVTAGLDWFSNWRMGRRLAASDARLRALPGWPLR
jgi:hypothetical protein